jgi:hypothetical protein
MARVAGRQVGRRCSSVRANPIGGEAGESENYAFQARILDEEQVRRYEAKRNLSENRGLSLKFLRYFV